MKMVIVPILARRGAFCFVEGISHHLAWPAGWAKRAVLLDFEPFWVRTAQGPAECRIGDQVWPRDAVRFARLYGAKISRRAGLPVVDSSLVADHSNRFIHNAFLVFEKPGAAASLGGARRFRKILHGTRVQDTKLPRWANCVLFLTEARLLFAKAQSMNLMVGYLSGLLEAAFGRRPGPNKDSGVGFHDVATWLLQEANGRGVRVHSIESANKNGVAGFRVRGQWGTGGRILASDLGESDGARFVKTVRLNLR